MKLNVNIEKYSHPNSSETFFKNISLSVNDKEITFLIGMSGIGKTTLLNILLGLSEGTLIGSITYSTNETLISPAQMIESGSIGYLAQEFQLIPWLNVKKNILLPSLLNKNLSIPTDYEILRILNLLGLEERILTIMPYKLSFGMRARIGMARVFIYKPHFIFLDELFTGIDTVNNEIISNHLSSYVKNNENACFAVTHNLERAIKIADNILIFNSNRELFKLDSPFNLDNIIELIKEEEI